MATVSCHPGLRRTAIVTRITRPPAPRREQAGIAPEAGDRRHDAVNLGKAIKTMCGIGGDMRHAGNQPTRVGMRGRPDDIGNAPFLDPPPGIHHQHPLRHLGDSTHIMGDQDDRGLELCAKIAQQSEYLGLNGDVERRGRFIGNQDFRLAGKGNGDHHPLPLATRQLMRIIINPRRGVWNPHRFHQVDRPHPRGAD